MLNTRIKCCGMKKSEGRLFVRDKLIILFMKKLNLFNDLFWKNKVIGIGKGHDDMYRSMYVQEPILVYLDYIVCHNNRIKATFFCLYVGIVRLWNFTFKLQYWVCGGILFLYMVATDISFQNPLTFPDLSLTKVKFP